MRARQNADLVGARVGEFADVVSRRIIKELNARQQRKDLQGVDQLYGGSGLNLPAAGEPAAAREAE